MLWQKVPTHAVFVYGTLKRGFYNFDAVMAPFGAGAAFQALARTEARFPLFVDHYRVPYLVNRPGTGHQITGELFSVDDECLAALDVLEGVASGRYERRSIQVEVVSGDDAISPDEPLQRADAWFYAIRDVPEIQLDRRGPQGRQLLAEYSAEVHSRYVPKAGRDESLRRAWGGYDASAL